MAKSLTGLIILDGFGIGDCTHINAIEEADTPNLDKIFATYPNTTINASGMGVGLPEGQMGNSEVGHMNMGAGRVVYQELTRITKSIKDGDFFENPTLTYAMQATKKANKALHVFGLLSDGGVHSHIDHYIAVIEMAKQQGLEKVYLHCFMDGRDVSPLSGKGFIQRMQEEVARIGVGEIATVIGRFYAMDRDNRWDRVEKAYNAIVLGEGQRGEDPVAMMQQSYDEKVTDEFINPIVVTKNGEPVATVQQDDSIIFIDFRPDRARELTRAFIFKDFDRFERKKGYFPVHFVTMTQYDDDFDGHLDVVFKPQFLKNTMGEYLSNLGKTQLRIAETEKYAHVTFFFSGGVESEYPGEDRVLIPSPKVETYDLQPEMSAFEVAAEAVKRINSGAYDFMVLNFANLDMVGHTGIIEATIQAVEAIDQCVGMVVDAILKGNGNCLMTADHGNAECMGEENGCMITAHTTNPVPLVYIGNDAADVELSENGSLCDLAPTLLCMMGLDKPEEMTGHCLLK